MKDFFAELRPAILATLVLAVVCSGLYPLVVFGISQALFHDKANGSLIVDSDGTVRGSRLLGQNFSDAKYFHPRPSAAGNGYDAANSGASNLGPTSEKLKIKRHPKLKKYPKRRERRKIRRILRQVKNLLMTKKLMMKKMRLMN